MPTPVARMMSTDRAIAIFLGLSSSRSSHMPSSDEKPATPSPAIVMIRPMLMRSP